MNRVEFMNQLESLLQGIPSTEREEAVQYYNDYFDDAGPENEQEVIEALGNPAKVAENIRRDLAGNGENFAQKVKASDRVIMEYGKKSQGNPETGNKQEDPFGNTGNSQENSFGGTGNSQGNSFGGYGNQGGNPFGDYGSSRRDPFGSMGNAQESSFGSGAGGQYSSGSAWSRGNDFYSGYEPEKPEKKKMPAWAIALLVTVLVFASPALLGVAFGIVGGVFGLLAGWFAMIFGFGAAAVVLLLVMVVLIVVGILCIFINPWAGMALVGGGLICGCIGLLFLMLTVAMAGIATPAIFRGIGFVLRGFKRKRAMAN